VVVSVGGLASTELGRQVQALQRASERVLDGAERAVDVGGRSRDSAKAVPARGVGQGVEHAGGDRCAMVYVSPVRRCVPEADCGGRKPVEREFGFSVSSSSCVKSR